MAKKSSFFARGNAIAVMATLVTVLYCDMASAQWHSWSQSARNGAIVDETAEWDNGDDGGQCKMWVQQDVVPNASGLTGLIPTTSANVCYWNYGSYVVGRSGYMEGAVPGEIVQMKLGSEYGSGPHTFVVIAVGWDGFTVKESNWCLNDCELIGTRYIDFDDFYDQVDCYTIYYVL